MPLRACYKDNQYNIPHPPIPNPLFPSLFPLHMQICSGYTKPFWAYTKIGRLYVGIVDGRRISRTRYRALSGKEASQRARQPGQVEKKGIIEIAWDCFDVCMLIGTLWNSIPREGKANGHLRRTFWMMAVSIPGIEGACGSGREGRDYLDACHCGDHFCCWRRGLDLRAREGAERIGRSKLHRWRISRTPYML